MHHGHMYVQEKDPQQSLEVCRQNLFECMVLQENFVFITL